MNFHKVDTNYPNLPLRHLAQTHEWALTGFPTPLFQANDYPAAHFEARHKAIIPWLCDITSTNDMKLLADALHQHNATVTLMNLSNVMLAGKPIIN